MFLAPNPYVSDKLHQYDSYYTPVISTPSVVMILTVKRRGPLSSPKYAYPEMRNDKKRDYGFVFLFPKNIFSTAMAISIQHILSHVTSEILHPLSDVEVSEATD